MFKQILVALFALFASAQAFGPPTPTAAFGVRTAVAPLQMAMQTPDFKKGIMTASAAVMPVIFSSSAAMATEGTNEWFGVDDPRLLAVLFLGHLAILTLWLQQYGDADEDDDMLTKEKDSMSSSSSASPYC